MSRDDPAQFIICLVVVAVECGNDDSFIDARRAGAPQIRLQRSDRVPRRGHSITFAGMAVTIDDLRIEDQRFCAHRLLHSACFSGEREPRSPAAMERYQMLVAIALWKLGKWNFSFGP